MQNKPQKAYSGVVRSLRLYHGDRERRARMVEFYRQFFAVEQDSTPLAFDIGAHVGDRTLAFAALGARVVAVEPQPAVLRALRLVTAKEPGVVLVPAAMGAGEGRMVLHINTDNPTVSTLSGAFVEAADGAEGWEGQEWKDRVEVDVTTLDTLIARYGVPDFVKIDVEGHEDAVLEGLTQPLATVSFEVTTIHRAAALNALKRLSKLGDYCFALSLGEGFRLDTPWEDADAMAHRIRNLPHSANSGDVYATRSSRLGRLVPAGGSG